MPLTEEHIPAYSPVSRHKELVQAQEKRHRKAQTSAGVSQAPPQPRRTAPTPTALFSTQTPFPTPVPPVRTQCFAKHTFFFFFFNSCIMLGSTKHSYTRHVAAPSSEQRLHTQLRG